MKKSNNSSLSALKKAVKRMKPYRISLFFSFLLALVSVILSLYLPILVGNAVDSLSDFSLLSPILRKIALCALLSGLSQWGMNLLNNRTVYGVIRDLRRDGFAKFRSLPLSYLDSHPTGDLVSRLISDSDTFGDGLLMGFSQLFTGVLTILGTLCFMLSIQPLITLAVVILTPLSLLIAKYISTHTADMFRLQAKTRGEQTALCEEMIGGAKVVSAFSQEKSVYARFDEVNGRLQTYSLRATFFSSLVNPSTRFLNNLIYAAVAFLGAIMVIRGNGMTVGTLTCFLSYAGQYAKPFNEISGVITELQNALTCASRVFELLEAPEEESDAALPALPAPRGQVEFRDVSFSYLPEKPLISHFNLSVKPGQRIAIVGPTGCGKTTLINLLMRFYEVGSGQILLDGQDIRKVTRESLRQGFGMVLQDTWLLNGTVRENLLFGNPDATDEEMIRAAKLCHADSFIRRLPNGYDTVISENGSLSGGQRQLLCITRVMLASPSILILDEATSSIDTRTEQKISSAFSALMEGRTSFIVAHRLSTVQSADLILVMNHGQIAEQGTHSQLLQKGGLYAELYQNE